MTQIEQIRKAILEAEELNPLWGEYHEQGRYTWPDRWDHIKLELEKMEAEDAKT